MIDYDELDPREYSGQRHRKRYQRRRKGSDVAMFLKYPANRDTPVVLTLPPERENILFVTLIIGQFLHLDLTDRSGHDTQAEELYQWNGNRWVEATKEDFETAYIFHRLT